MKTYKAEMLLDGDITKYGVVTDVTGMGPTVIVDLEDGTSVRLPREELVEVQ